MGYLADLKTKAIYEGVSVEIAMGFDNQPEDPTNVYTIWETGRFGLETEDVLDNPTFQCLTRGSTGAVAWEMADAFERLVLSWRKFYLGDKYALEIRPVSGPVNMGTDERNRTEFSANYRIKMER